MTDPRTRRGPLAAFTLVEVLVVIAIIALLVGILVPALGAARGSARAVVCASNMRQLAVGHALYANLYDDISLPGRMAKIGASSDPRNHYDVGNGLHFRPRWMVTMGAGAGFFAFAQPSTEPSGENDNNRALEHEVFRDPGVRDWVNNRNYALGYNFQFLGNTRRHASGRLVRFPVRLHAIDGRTVLFADTLGTAATYPPSERRAYNPRPDPDNRPQELANHGWSLDPPRLTADSDNCDESRDNVHRSAVDERHGGHANVAWVDGHAEAMTAEELGYRRDDRGAYPYLADGATNRLFSGTGSDRDPSPIR